MPDRTNMGTASKGKESRPPNIARIRYFAPTVKDGSKTDGSTDVIPSVIDTGIAMTSPITNMIKRNNITKKIQANTCIFFMNLFLIFPLLIQLVFQELSLLLNTYLMQNFRILYLILNISLLCISLQ